MRLALNLLGESANVSNPFCCIDAELFLQLTVLCTNEEMGCQWKGHLKDLEVITELLATYQ